MQDEHDAEWEVEESSAEGFRSEVAQASCQVMDAINGETSDHTLRFYNAARQLVTSLVESGLELDHAAQVMASFAAGAAIDAVREGTDA